MSDTLVASRSILSESFNRAETFTSISAQPILMIEIETPDSETIICVEDARQGKNMTRARDIDDLMGKLNG